MKSELDDKWETLKARIVAALRAFQVRTSGAIYILPSDFDEAVYELLHEDVAKSKMSGGLHYLLYGKAEGRRYLQASHDNEILINPLPGVHLSAFKESLGLPPQTSPLGEYLARGGPTGPWNLFGIKKKPASNLVIRPFSVIHFHCYYPELLDEFLNFGEPFFRRPSTSLVVTYSVENAKPLISQTLNKRKIAFRLIRVHNQGRNLGALKHLLTLPEFADVQIWGHFHSKKSAHLSSQDAECWRRFIYTSLLRNGKGAVDYDDILAAIQRDPDLAIVFPDDPNEYGWGENLKIATQLAAKEGIDIGVNEPKFPVGAMFIARRLFLTRVLHLVDGNQAKSREPLPLDGSAWHAIERLLGALPSHLGMTFAVNRGNADGYVWRKAAK